MKKASSGFASGSLSPKLVDGLGGTSVPTAVKLIATTFVLMQERRHKADYNLRAKVRRREVEVWISDVERSIRAWPYARDTPAGRLYLIALLINDRLRE